MAGFFSAIALSGVCLSKYMSRAVCGAVSGSVSQCISKIAARHSRRHLSFPNVHRTGTQMNLIAFICS